MEIKKRKILIIEDDEKCFNEVSNAIEAKLSKSIEVFPKLNQFQGTWKNFNHLVEDYIEVADFDQMLEHYSDVDLFIVDVFLKDEHAADGFELEKKIKLLGGKNPPPILIISTNYYTRDNYIWKGEDKYTNQIIKKIIEKFPDVEVELGNANTSSIPKIRFIERVFKNYKMFGLYDTLLEFFKEVGHKWRQLIHLGISSVFYCLIMMTTYYAATSMYKEFFPSQEAATVNETLPSSLINTEAARQIQKEHDETLILEHAEKIFLYLLPIFIVFGFYIYYKTNTKIYFFSGRIQPDEQEASTHSMNLTKSIFVSSIISYTLIKVIDKIFFTHDTSLPTLISAGILLLVLMGYFILLNHHNKAEIKNGNKD